MTANLIFISGSTRQQSFNSRLAKSAAAIAQQLGANAEFVDLADYPMPIYNGDLEEAEGLPEAAIALKERFVAADGVCIASPEYNSSLPALLKNSLDWISRPAHKEEPPLHAFKGKTALILAASPGALGGIRVLVPLRLWLSNIGMNVLGGQLAVAKAHECFGEQGELTHDYYRKQLNQLVQQFVDAS